MLIELLVAISLLFLIAVLFYRQRRSDFTILQMEYEQIDDQLQELLSERQPLVVRGVPPPKGLTHTSLQSIQRLAAFPVAGHTLSTILANPAMLASAKGAPVLNTANRQLLAEELALPVWASMNWLPRFSQTTWFGAAVGTTKEEAVLGGLGLFRTTALATCIFPTEGTYAVSIVLKDTEAFLPPNWEWRYTSSFTTNDTPLVSDLKYLDIMLRPGTMLCLPPHTLVAMEPSNPATFTAAVILEYHEPISMLAKSVKSA